MEAHRPSMFRLWAVHIILASSIVYSLLPGPRKVLEKPQRVGGGEGGDDCCVSCLVTFVFLRETYSTVHRQLLQAGSSHGLEFVL